jgi:hypothetical protein
MSNYYVALVVDVNTREVTPCKWLHEISRLVGERIATMPPGTFRVGDFIVTPYAKSARPLAKMNENQMKHLLKRCER